jgi:hypothetical protein
MKRLQLKKRFIHVRILLLAIAIMGGLLSTGSISQLSNGEERIIDESVSEWIPFLELSYNGSKYNVTLERITPEDLDQQIFTRVYFGIGALYHGFSIKGTSDLSKIAIQTRSGYYAAYRNHKQS